jgi:hypothetical protein
MFCVPYVVICLDLVLNVMSCHVRCFTGLGTSTSKEAKEYFSDMHRHRIRFKYGGPQDDHCINMVSNFELCVCTRAHTVCVVRQIRADYNNNNIY